MKKLLTFVLALVWAWAFAWAGRNPSAASEQVVVLLLVAPVAVALMAAVIWIARAKGTVLVEPVLDPIRVFVWTKVGEFSDEPTRARQARAQELAEQLYRPGGRPPTVPVADRGSADVVVEIVSWEDVVVVAQAFAGTVTSGGYFPDRRITRTEKRLVAMLSAGAYTTQMVGAQGWTKSAAGDVAGQVRDWIRGNHPQLMGRRGTARDVPSSKAARTPA